MVGGNDRQGLEQFKAPGLDELGEISGEGIIVYGQGEIVLAGWRRKIIFQTKIQIDCL